MIGPHHSIIRRFTSGAHGAAAWTTVRREDTSYMVRTSSGSFNMRTNMVGTNWAWVTLCSSDQGETVLGVEVLHDDAVPPMRMAVIDQTSGAEWYSGAGLR